jgi:hypothetical protein
MAKNIKNEVATTSAPIEVSTMNKQGLFDFLKSHDGDSSLGKSLLDRISYTVKAATQNMKKVTKDDLYDLADELSLALTATPAPVENFVKAKVPAKKTEEAPAEEAKTPAKKGALKPKGKTKTETKEAPAKKETPKMKVPSYFPATISLDTLGEMTSLSGKLTTYDEVLKAVSDGRQLVLACHWTKDEMEDYAETNEVDVPKGGFPKDLDLLQTVVTGETVKRLWAMSFFTEAMYWFDEQDFEYVEFGDGLKSRESNGMMFELYELKDTE